MTKKTWPFFISIILLLFVGCHNGCTTRTIMKKEAKVFHKDGEKFVLVAKLIDFRNSKRKYSNRHFPRKITHTYGVEFEISGMSLNQFHFHSVDVTNPNTVDLNKFFKKIRIAISKDKNHLALGYKNNLLKVFHFLNGKEIELFSNYPEVSSWNALNINGYPSPEEVILKDLEENCPFAHRIESNVHDLFNGIDPSDSAHVRLLNLWPDCRIAKVYYQGSKLQDLASNNKWKFYAEARALEVLNDPMYTYRKKDYEYFFEALNSEELNSALESSSDKSNIK